MSNDYRMHVCLREMNRLMGIWKYEEAEEKLKILEENLDMSERINRQVVLDNRAILNECLGRIRPEERLMQLQEALTLTIPKGVKLENWPLKREEMSILICLANTWMTLGNGDEAIKLLRIVIDICENAETGVNQNASQYLLAAFNLEKSLGEKKEHAEALMVSQKAIKVAFRMEDGEAVVEFLNKIAWNMEKLSKQEYMNEKNNAYPLVYGQALRMADLIEYEIYQNYIRKYCRENFGAFF